MRRKRAGRGRYQRGGRNNRVKLNFTPVIVLLCLSIGCGYAAAKYVLDPVVNYVPQLTAEKSQTDEATNSAGADSNESGNNSDKTSDNNNSSVKEDVLEDEVSVKEKGSISGYALQFGCYSSKAAAETAMTGTGINGLQIIEQEDMYKIIGEIYKTKAEAKAALEELPDTVNSFVTAVYE